MSTRGTVKITDIDWNVEWAYISSDAGPHAAKLIEKTAHWVALRKGKAPTAKAILAHLQKLKGGGIFEPSTIHPFDIDPAEDKVFSGGERSPFNEYEYHLDVFGATGNWRLEVDEIRRRQLMEE